MASYNPSSIKFLAGLVLGIADLIVFVFALIPAGLASALIVSGLPAGATFSDFMTEVQGIPTMGWIIIGAISLITAGIGYLLTSLFRVVMHLALALVQIEANSREILGRLEARST